MSSTNRIDGWKAIGIYLGRERTTVIRWARTRALPVHRIPGGKKATVYALKDELDRWVASASASDLAPDLTGDGESVAAAPGLRTGFGLRRVVLLGGVLALLVAAVGFVWWPRAPVAVAQTEVVTLPKDPESARLYLQARDEWARRTPESLTSAIAALEQVTQREPDFALAYSGLADAFLLAREFGAMRDAEAFARARKAAEKALALDPDRASAHRALGFVLYWWDRNPPRAGEAFRRAMALAPQSAQTHFWYGNILADNGEHAAALRELNAARMIEPGSVAVQADMVWATWSAGRTDEARRALDELLQTHPDFAGVYDCLSDMRLAEGDFAGYVGAFTHFARLRGDPALIAHADALASALGKGDGAVYDVLMARALGDIADNQRLDHSWPAFLASVRGDRARLLALLETADRSKEAWGNAGLRRRIEEKWRGDAEISALLASRRAQRVEAEGPTSVSHWGRGAGAT